MDIQCAAADTDIKFVATDRDTKCAVAHKDLECVVTGTGIVMAAAAMLNLI